MYGELLPSVARLCRCPALWIHALVFHSTEICTSKPYRVYRSWSFSSDGDSSSRRDGSCRIATLSTQDLSLAVPVTSLPIFTSTICRAKARPFRGRVEELVALFATA